MKEVSGSDSNGFKLMEDNMDDVRRVAVRLNGSGGVTQMEHCSQPAAPTASPTTYPTSSPTSSPTTAPAATPTRTLTCSTIDFSSLTDGQCVRGRNSLGDGINVNVIESLRPKKTWTTSNEHKQWRRRILWKRFDDPRHLLMSPWQWTQCLFIRREDEFLLSSIRFNSISRCLGFLPSRHGCTRK